MDEADSNLLSAALAQTQDDQHEDSEPLRQIQQEQIRTIEQMTSTVFDQKVMGGCG